MSLTKRWMSPPLGGLFLWGVWLLGGVGAQVQAQRTQTQAQTKATAGSGAQVYQVPATGEAARFEVPQVRLPDAVAARRINRRILQLLVGDNIGTSASAAPALQQLRQASHVTFDLQAGRVATKQVQPALGDLTDLTEFALTPQKHLLFYRVGFAHVNLNFEPDGTYRFAYAGWLPRPLLRRALALAVPTRPKRGDGI